MRRLVFAFALLASACTLTNTPTSTSLPPEPALVATAGELCPILWRWQLTVGSVMNDMSSATIDEDDPETRRERYLAAFDRVREVNAALRKEIGGLSPGPYTDVLEAEVFVGLEAAEGTLDDLEAGVRGSEGDAALAYREMVPHIFLAVEKVIDQAKPELGGYGDDALIQAFLTVPQCQHGVKDANDGIPRYVPLG
jgi:hypothetical protein